MRPSAEPLDVTARRDGAPRHAWAERGAPDGRRSPRSSVQSVARACDILAILGDSNVPLSALEIANASGLDHTVVHRLLRTLAERDMVVEDRGAYGLGPGRCYAMAAAIRSQRGRAVAAVAVSGLEVAGQLADVPLLAVHLRRPAQAIGQALP
jgi:DNA-binding IclR family transcriptional regulator